MPFNLYSHQGLCINVLYLISCVAGSVILLVRPAGQERQPGREDKAARQGGQRRKGGRHGGEVGRTSKGVG